MELLAIAIDINESATAEYEMQQKFKNQALKTVYTISNYLRKTPKSDLKSKVFSI